MRPESLREGHFIKTEWLRAYVIAARFSNRAGAVVLGAFDVFGQFFFDTWVARKLLDELETQSYKHQ